MIMVKLIFARSVQLHNTMFSQCSTVLILLYSEKALTTFHLNYQCKSKQIEQLDDKVVTGQNKPLQDTIRRMSKLSVEDYVGDGKIV